MQNLLEINELIYLKFYCTTSQHFLREHNFRNNSKKNAFSYLRNFQSVLKLNQTTGIKTEYDYEFL